MKSARILVVTAILAAATTALAQAAPSQNQPAQKPPAQNPPAAGAAQAPAGAAGAAAPTDKKQPKAKSQPEADAYKAAMAMTDAAAMEKAANDFVVAYPNSDLSPILYRTVLRSYQAAGNNDKLMEMGQKMVASDPDDPEALIDVATVITETTKDTDIDKQQRQDQAMKYASHAVETADTDIPPGMTPDQETLFKGLMKSNAYGVIGLLDFKAAKNAEAADAFQKSIDAFPQQPDPVTVLRLSIALDRQEKYPAALKAAQQAVQLTQEGTPVGNLARKEQDKLTKLTAGAPAK